MNARRLISVTLTTLGVMAGGLLFAGAPAQAALTHVYTGKSFGPEGISAGGPLGAFSDPQSITVEQSTGDVYVYDAEAGEGSIYKFDSAGEPADYSGSSTNVIKKVGEVGEGEGEIAVDDSGGPDSGDIYFASGESGTENVLIFNAKGQPAGELKEEEGAPWGEPCGVAVDPEGNVYVGLYYTGVNKYTPKSGTLTDSDYVSSLTGAAVEETCNIAADAEGNVYTTQYGRGLVTRYEASQFGLPEGSGTLVDETGQSLSVDPFSNEVFIDESDAIAQYDSSGSRLGTFAQVGPGALSEENSFGVAVDHASGQVYVDGEGEIEEEEGEPEPDGERVVEIFGPGVVVPDVSIEAESELLTTSVTLNGTVNPDGAGNATCQIEYGEGGLYRGRVYRQTAPCSKVIPSGSSPVAVSAEVSGLSPDTSYSYRLSATNANGTNYSEATSFKTAVAHTPGPPKVEGQSSEHVGHTSATIKAQIDPEGLETQYHFEYGASTSYGTSVPIPDGKLAAGYSAENISAALTGLTLGTTYHFRVVASNADSPTPVYGPDQTVTTLPAALIDSDSVLSVTDTSATLQAQINPLGSDTHAYFQYGTTSCAAAPSACTDVPSPSGVDIGSGESEQSESIYLQGLAPGIVYYYRAVVSNALGTIYGAEHTFTTQSVDRAGFVLPDGREYEMVSPPSKHGGLINPISEQFGTIQASEAGGAIAYSAQAPVVGEPPGNQLFDTEVLSVRGPEGWSSLDIAPSNNEPSGIQVGSANDYRVFSSDLSVGLIEPAGTTPLSPPLSAAEAGHQENTSYLRISGACEAAPEKCYLPLVTQANVPPGTKFGREEGESRGPSTANTEFEGASPDLSHIVLDSTAALTSTPIDGPSLYEWAAGQLQLVSVLPKSEGGAPAPSSELGRQDGVRHAVSDDGSRIVWRTAEHLYMRDVTTQETVQLDAPAKGAPENHGAMHQPVFQTASSDGSKVFFTDVERLTEDSTATYGAPDLYECEVVAGPGGLVCDLSDLTVDEHVGESAGVQGTIPGASEDGSYVYFVANGVLAPGAAPGTCVEFVSSADETCNLYVRHGGTTTFIAALSGEDARDWAEGGRGVLPSLTSRVSPNGQYLAFMSERSLTGYDNADANSGVADEEVFLYDAQVGRLVCASCDPTGARPVGLLRGSSSAVLFDEAGIWQGRWLAGIIPGWTPYKTGASVYQSRYLSDSGRLFFDSTDALVPQDVNGEVDVYEYEPQGVGSCEASSATFGSASGGCVGLISSGTADEESVFIDASASGDDVFFLTPAQLVSQDYDSALDVYDAHACSAASPCVPSGPVAPPPCDTADSCKAAPSPQPEVFGPSGSATFSGAGNLVAPGSKPAVKSKMKALTRAQKLAKALKACKGKHKKSKRAACEARARKLYGAKTRGKQSREPGKRSRGVHVERNGR